MKKKIGIGMAVLAVLLVAAGVYFWYATQRPMYQPGVRSSAFLEPPAGPHDESFWTVELGVRLHHFSDGTGPAALTRPVSRMPGSLSSGMPVTFSSTTSLKNSPL